MSRSIGWQARFDLLLVLLDSWVATISSSRGAFGLASGRNYSPRSVGGKFGGVGAVGSSGGVLLLLLSAASADFGRAFGSLWVTNPALSCHLKSSLSCLTVWKLGSKLRWNWGLTRPVFWSSTRATLQECVEICRGRCLPLPLLSIFGECG